MVGVELILAALPLAISALEHYSDGLDPAKDCFRYNSTLKSVRTRLRIQQDLFEGTMRRLLIRELSPNQAQGLFSDAGQNVDTALWRTIGVDEKLRKRLGSKYGNFMDVVSEMESIMRRLLDGLDIEVGQSGGLRDPLLTLAAVKLGRKHPRPISGNEEGTVGMAKNKMDLWT